MTGERVRLAAGALTLELAPALGGAVARFDDEGRPVMRPAPDDATDVLQTACFPLVPYSNRVADGVFTFRGREVRLAANNRPQRHPLHGVGWRRPWSVVQADARTAVLALDWPGGDWPWAFRAEQRVALDEAGLTIAVSVENRSTEVMPAGLGLHPYFPCPTGTVLDARVETVWTVDADLFPVAVEPATGRYALEHRAIHHAGLDNGYGGWGGEAAIAWPDGRGVRLRADERFFQVYAPESEDVLCAEPVTHANGALNAPEAEQAALGLRALAPGERLTLTARFEPRRASGAVSG